MMKKILFAVLMAASTLVSALEAQYPINTNNMNVRWLYERYQMMLEEIDKSITKGSIGTLPQDADRWVSYTTNMRQYTDYWQSKSFIDWPVTHGKTYSMDDPVTVDCQFTDNQSACDLQTLVINARDELVVSTSAESLPMHLHPSDLTRQQSYWSSIEDYITTFMLPNNPLDEPVTAAEERLGLSPGFDKEQ